MTHTINLSNVKYSQHRDDPNLLERGGTAVLTHPDGHTHTIEVCASQRLARIRTNSGVITAKIWFYDFSRLCEHPSGNAHELRCCDGIAKKDLQDEISDQHQMTGSYIEGFNW